MVSLVNGGKEITLDCHNTICIFTVHMNDYDTGLRVRCSVSYSTKSVSFTNDKKKHIQDLSVILINLA